MIELAGKSVSIPMAAAGAVFLVFALSFLFWHIERHLRRRARAAFSLHRRRELEAIKAMASITGRGIDLEQMLDEMAVLIRRAFQGECEIALTGDALGAEKPMVVLSREEERAESEASRGAVREALLAFLAEENADSVSDADWARLPEAVQSWHTESGARSWVAVSLAVRGTTAGILRITGFGERLLGADERDFAIVLARQLGLAVERVLLLHETQQASDKLRDAREKLLQSEKMSAIGHLIAGVAHELNNPLTAILGYAELLRSEALTERGQSFVHKLRLQAQRTHRVAQNLLSFSRPRRPARSLVDLRHVLSNTLSLREFDLKLNDIAVETICDPRLPFVVGDEHQLEQVFLNILNNAVDAIMDTEKSGVLQIRMNGGTESVCVEFRDNGAGVREPGKVFEPFYTTKKAGKGSGLGLSICYGIVKEHGGEIRAYNQPEGGACFVLKLPVPPVDSLDRRTGTDS